MSDVLIFLALMGSLASIAFGVVLFFSRLAAIHDARRMAEFRMQRDFIECAAKVVAAKVLPRV
ncbi:hypothetical protein [Pseudoxanthomonas sp.]|uniref:hypothetical protein n=1 Tax=Pseudoxanthomonas sp. TaxID=1871049 RepID=UPI00261C0324|nr:hypothetical protein [Pseudoxanthomonas sp.]WDS36975.1 MAG: hypothetical protein O8I58_03435 [Pseudoxanthomonas sp.]